MSHNLLIMIFSRLILLNKWLEQGNCLFRRSQYSQAKEKYKEAIDHLPDIGSSQEQQPFSILRKSLLLNLSRCERRRGEFSSAIEISSRVVAEDQNDSEAFLTRAKAYKAAGLILYLRSLLLMSNPRNVGGSSR